MDLLLKLVVGSLVAFAILNLLSIASEIWAWVGRRLGVKIND